MRRATFAAFLLASFVQGDSAYATRCSKDQLNLDAASYNKSSEKSITADTVQPKQKYRCSMETPVKTQDKRHYDVVDANKTQDWFAAHLACNKKGLELAAPETVAELKVVFETIKTNGKESFWVAGTDMEREPGFFVWPNGRRLLHELWDAKQPSGYGHGRDTCAYLVNSKDKWRLKTDKCHEGKMHFALCQQPNFCRNVLV